MGAKTHYYNIIMSLIGLSSFFICFVNIPLVYLVVALGLNVFYTFLYGFELLFIKRFASDDVRMNYPKFSFIAYLILSMLLVVGMAVFISIQSGD